MMVKILLVEAVKETRLQRNMLGYLGLIHYKGTDVKGDKRVYLRHSSRYSLDE